MRLIKHGTGITIYSLFFAITESRTFQRQKVFSTALKRYAGYSDIFSRINFPYTFTKSIKFFKYCNSFRHNFQVSYKVC